MSEEIVARQLDSGEGIQRRNRRQRNHSLLEINRNILNVSNQLKKCLNANINW
jgi:hypothetical protein